VRTDSGLFSLTAPLTGLFSSWRANMVYRADERLESVRSRLLERSRGQKIDLPPDVFTDQSLECQADPSLNWVLTTGDRANIHEDVRVSLRLPALAEGVVQGRWVPPEHGDEKQSLQRAGVQLPPPGAAVIALPPAGEPSAAARVVQGREDYQKIPHSAQQTRNSQGTLAEELGQFKLPEAAAPKK
jgi:hypothetical protein